MGLRDWLRRREPIQQAWTITPDAADLGDVASSESDVAGIFRASTPSPVHIEAVALISEELGGIMKRLRQEVWREGVVVESRFQGQCMLCGQEVEDAGAICPKCHAPKDSIRLPRDEDRVFLEEKAESVNSDGESIIELGAQITDDGNKHGRGYVVFQNRYSLDARGIIQATKLLELRRAAPWTMQRLQNEVTGRSGGQAYICLTCRNNEKYAPEKKRRACATCGNATYDAWYKQEANQRVMYYLPNEVHEAKWHYPDGSSPIARLWVKVLTLAWMDRYAFYAFDPQRGKAPGKILLTWGGDEKRLMQWADRDAQKRRKNPYRLSHLHMEVPGGPIQEKEAAGATVVDLGDEEIKKQSPELYERHLAAIRREYGVSQLQSGEAGGSGGLNNEQEQLREGANVAEAIQKAHLEWMNLAAKRWGVAEYAFNYPGLIPEDEVVDAEAIEKQLEIADKAAKQGLEVRWENGSAVISDGEVKAAPEPSPFGAFQQAAPKKDEEQIKAVRAGFRGPAGGAEASDAAHFQYEGLSVEESQAINDEVVDAMTQSQGWSIKSITERIQPILERAGVEEAQTRAEGIARTETAALQSEFKDRYLAEVEERRGEPVLVKMIGASDTRTTKLSMWLRQQAGDGVPRAQMKALIDQGIELAKQGAFTKTGSLKNVPGEPITLPQGFRRRGYVAHFQDRDDVVVA